jgi:hypothetical protein
MRSNRRAVAIEYSPDLMARVSAPRRRRKRWSVWTCVALIIILLSAGLAVWSYRHLGADKTSVFAMAEDFAQGLVSGDLYGTAEQYLIETIPLEARRGELVRVRQGLEESGMNMSLARPLGYGGSLAIVGGAPRPVLASIGWLYLESEGQIVGVELSARETEAGEFKITRLWKWTTVDLPIETHAQQAYEAFAREANEEAGSNIEQPRYIFGRFDS